LAFALKSKCHWLIEPDRKRLGPLGDWKFGTALVKTTPFEIERKGEIVEIRDREKTSNSTRFGGDYKPTCKFISSHLLHFNN
jgi:hypothetical protein